MKIVEYRTILGEDTLELDESVNHFITEGWQPLGGVAVSYHEDNKIEWLYQVLVKYEKTSDSN